MADAIALPDVPRTYPRDRIQDWADQDWLEVPAAYVPTISLIPTQEGVSLERIIHVLNGGEPETGDLARAVMHEGRLYLHDGHHRWLVALMRGEPVFPVRVVTATEEPS